MKLNHRPIEWLIVGLGNPGPKYKDTRHNVGFVVVDALAKSEGIRFNEGRAKAVVGRGNVEDVPVALVKPFTYMNLSGRAVSAVARFYKIPSSHILVVYDDLDLPHASLRLRLKGGPGGHNGMKSVIQHLGTKEFPRVRIGIDRPTGRMPIEAYVLRKFSRDEQKSMRYTYEAAQDAIRLAVTEGMERAMNNFN